MPSSSRTVRLLRRTTGLLWYFLILSLSSDPLGSDLVTGDALPSLLLGGFGVHPVQLHLVALTGIGRLGAGLERPDAPEVFVYSLFHVCPLKSTSDT